MTLVQTVLTGTLYTALAVPVGGIFGGLGGYIYAKLADLPLQQAAKAYAIWGAASFAIACFVDYFLPTTSYKYLIHAGITLLSSSIGVAALQKRGLIGNKLKIFILVCSVLAMLGNLNKFREARELEA